MELSAVVWDVIPMNGCRTDEEVTFALQIILQPKTFYFYLCVPD